jgi:hypothetical protein
MWLSCHSCPLKGPEARVVHYPTLLGVEWTSPSIRLLWGSVPAFALMPKVIPQPLPPLDPAPHDAAARGAVVLTLSEVGRVARWWRTRQRRPLGDAAGMLGVTRRLLAELERGERGVHLDKALNLLAGMGFDVVLVPRDPSVSLQAAEQGRDA